MTRQLKELEKKAKELCQEIVGTTETEFNEEIEKQFQKVKEIKEEANDIVTKLIETGELEDYSKSAEIQRIFDNNKQFRDKKIFFLNSAKEYFIEKVEELRRTDEEINNTSFIRSYHAG